MRIFTLFFLSSIIAFAQNKDFEKVGVKPTSYTTFWGKDISGNDFFSANNNLYKCNEKDTLNYTNNKFGKIASLETFNLLQTLVFYKQNNAFVLLDAQFNETNSVVFSEINCEFLLPASQNELWFYDGLRQKIGLYSLRNNKFTYLSNAITSPIKNCFSDYNNFYWINEQMEVFSISKFGKISRMGHIEPYDIICKTKETEFLYVYDNQLFFYDVVTGDFESLEVTEKLIENIHFKDRILSIFANSEISTYQIKK